MNVHIDSYLNPDIRIHINNHIQNQTRLNLDRFDRTLRFGLKRTVQEQAHTMRFTMPIAKETDSLVRFPKNRSVAAVTACKFRNDDTSRVKMRFPDRDADAPKLDANA